MHNRLPVKIQQYRRLQESDRKQIQTYNSSLSPSVKYCGGLQHPFVLASITAICNVIISFSAGICSPSPFLTTSTWRSFTNSGQSSSLIISSLYCFNKIATRLVRSKGFPFKRRSGNWFLNTPKNNPIWFFITAVSSDI